MSEVFVFGKSGSLEKLEPFTELPIGLRVYAFGVGMSQSIYCVTGPMTERGQEICLVSNWCRDAYFASPRMYIDKYSRPLSKKFGIGIYWDDMNRYIYPTSKVEAAIRKAELTEIKIAKLKEEERIANAKELAELPLKYPHLKKLENHDYMSIRANIVAELKHRFPGTKFSIKKQYYDSITIRWKDGASYKQVQEVESLFTDHETDFTGDYRDYAPSNFNHLFGGINYISLERDMDEEIKSLVHILTEKYTDYEEYELFAYLRRIWWNTDIPTGATNFRLTQIEHSGLIDNMYKIEFDVQEHKDGKLQSLEGSESNGIEIVDYSDRSIAVIGDTKPIKEQLKALGGRFNFKLSCGAGWVFPKSKKEIIVETLQELL